MSSLTRAARPALTSRRIAFLTLACLTALALAWAPSRAHAAAPAPTGLAPQCAADGLLVTCTFGTGGDQSFVVPAGVTALDVVAFGARGGAWTMAAGGRGARVSATLPVTPGSELFVNVGAPGSGTVGRDYFYPGGGGGAADIRTQAGVLASRVLVAGGGGGSGIDNFPDLSRGRGGDAGSDGVSGQSNGHQGGYAGTQSAGGAPGERIWEGGIYCGLATAGGLGSGGTGHRVAYAAGGFGGAGYYGGGGGEAMCSSSLTGGGGGGGSNLVPAGGDGTQFNEGTWGSVTITFARTASVTTVGAPATSTYGDAVALTATVSSAAALDGGNVQFHDGVDPIGSPQPVDAATGVATLTTSALAGGSHSISASFGGTATLAGSSSSPAVPLVVAKAATASTLSLSSASTTYGSPPLATATVTSGAAPATAGAVQFSLDGSPVGSPVAVGADGVATWRGAPAVGDHTVGASYSGTGNFLASDATAAPVAVAIEPTALAVSTAGYSSWRSPISFTVTASAPGASEPSLASPTGGTVQLFEGGTAISGAVAVNGAPVVIGWSGAIGGMHTIRAEYTGSSSYAASAPATTTVSVYNVYTQTGLTASPQVARPDTGTTLTATVQGGDGARPTSGYVMFRSAYGGGYSYYNAYAQVGAGGTATTQAILPVGDHSLQASYNGNQFYLSSQSYYQTWVRVQLAPTTISMASSLAQSRPLQPVTLTASISDPGHPTPSGTVTFYTGALEPIGGPQSIPADGVVSLETTALPAGTDTVYAVYSGSGVNAAATSAPVALEVRRAASTISLAAPARSAFGEQVALTAAVGFDGADGGGTVSFFDGATLLGTRLVAPGATEVSLSTDALPLGSRTLRVEYGGDVVYLPSDASAAHVVEALPVTMALTGPESSPRGAATTFTATLSAVRGAPTGTVEFFDGDDQIGSSRPLTGGVASLTTSVLAVDVHEITARYEGQAQYAPTSATRTHTVDRMPTAVTLTATATAADPRAFRIDIAVAALAGTRQPAGTLYVYDGDRFLRSATTSSTGTASFTTGALSAGTHPLTVRYEGDGRFEPSSSPRVSAVVAPPTATAHVVGTRFAARSGIAPVLVSCAASIGASCTGTLAVAVSGASVTSFTIARGTSAWVTLTLPLFQQAALRTNPTVSTRVVIRPRLAPLVSTTYIAVTFARSSVLPTD